MKVTFSLVWFDAWIGAFWDQQKRILYVCPLPCCVVKIEPAQPATDTIDELRALRELREVCGSYCERLPVEVREALHAIPEIEKTHPAHTVATVSPRSVWPGE